MTKAKHPGGRPTTVPPAMQDKICERLALGESLSKICRDDSMPGMSTIYAVLLRDDKFQERYTRAREQQSDTYMDQCVDIADDTANDTITLINKNGEEYEKTNFDHINRSRLKVDTRIKIAEKMAPRKYMPQNRTEHAGGVTVIYPPAVSKPGDTGK